MERAREVAQYWSWLPAFRAVAETEHLPTAAKALCVSPSAVSRTLKLLEEHLGQTLFDRSNGRLELNASGEILLACVRASMRLVHEGTSIMRDGQLRGTVRISAPSEISGLFFLPLLPQLLLDNPHLNVETSTVRRPSEGLQRGDLDVALSYDLAPERSLFVRPICQFENDVFVPKGTDVANIETFPFCVPHDAERGTVLDAWPPSRSREIRLRVASTAAAIDAAKRGIGAVVLPVCVGLDAGLARLHVDSPRRTALMIGCRSPLPGLVTPAETIASEIQKHMAEQTQSLVGVKALDWRENTGELIRESLVA